jgi:hypothetical protein
VKKTPNHGEPMVGTISLIGLALLLASCGSSDESTDLPAGGLYATFAVGSQSFHASITHPDGMAEAMALWSGTSGASIPVGELECAPAAWNRPWRWYLRPDTVRFAEVTIELCDGEPSYVEGNCESFGGGSYCPWGAEMTSLRDCSTDPGCPAAPR